MFSSPGLCNSWPQFKSSASSPTVRFCCLGLLLHIAKWHLNRPDCFHVAAAGCSLPPSTLFSYGSHQAWPGSCNQAVCAKTPATTTQCNLPPLWAGYYWLIQKPLYYYVIRCSSPTHSWSFFLCCSLALRYCIVPWVFLIQQFSCSPLSFSISTAILAQRR